MQSTITVGLINSKYDFPKVPKVDFKWSSRSSRSNNIMKKSLFSIEASVANTLYLCTSLSELLLFVNVISRLNKST